MSLMGILIFLIVIGVMFWAVRALAGAFGIPPQIVIVIQVILVVICVLYLLQTLGGSSINGPLRLSSHRTAFVPVL